jgi:hypothetical protein
VKFMPNFSDIIDNRHLMLKNEILTKLDGSKKIKFAVGYLYLSGFFQIAEKLENLQSDLISNTLAGLGKSQSF